MDPKAVTQQMDEATKALKSSFTESSTKLFGSVMDAKRGLFSGITSKFDQVANIVGGTGSATGASEQTKNAEAGGEPGNDNATAEGGTAEGGTAAGVPSTGGRTFVDGKPPPFRRRNTNPFMEGYDPNVVENEIPPPNVTGNDGTVTAASESGNATTVTADGAPVAPTGQHSVEPSRAWDMAANAMHAVTDLLPSLPKIPSGGPSAFFSPSTRTTAADQPGPPPPSKPRKKRTEDGGESDADSDATEGCDDRGEDEDLGEGGVVADRSEAASRNSMNSNDPDDLTQLDAATKDSMNFMKYFVDKIFTQGEEVTAADKSKFGELCQQGTGRLWFAKYVNSQRVNSKAVPEPVILNLVQHIAVVLFECNEAEDYGPAKTLMNMAFTYYHEVQETKTAQETANIFNKLKSLVGQGKRKTYLYSYLKDQAIWQSPRFWNAAFFFAMQHERANKPATSTWSAALSNIPIQKLEQNDEVRQQENLTVSQLRTFTCNMRALGVPKDHCLEFIRRQASLANLPSAQVKLLRENMEQWTEESANK